MVFGVIGAPRWSIKVVPGSFVVWLHSLKGGQLIQHVLPHQAPLLFHSSTLCPPFWGMPPFTKHFSCFIWHIRMFCIIFLQPICFPFLSIIRMILETYFSNKFLLIGTGLYTNINFSSLLMLSIVQFHFHWHFLFFHIL